MTKIILTKGDCVSAKKWSGEQFLGIYEHTYDDGSYLVRDVKLMRDFNVHKRQIRLATEEEEKQIKQLLKEPIITNDDNKEEHNNDDELDEALAATEE